MIIRKVINSNNGLKSLVIARHAGRILYDIHSCVYDHRTKNLAIYGKDYKQEFNASNFTQAVKIISSL